MQNLLIKDGLVVTEGAETVTNVFIAGEKIKTIGPDISLPRDCEVIDAWGKILVPGGIDAHTHLHLDAGIAVASDDFYTGTVAAAWGGTTTIIDHPAFGPAGCPLDHQIKKYHGFAAGKAVIDYGFHGVIQHVDDLVLDQMEALIDEGITSYKVYLTYNFKLDDGDVYRVLERAGQMGLVITVHPENDGIIQYLRAKFKSQGNLSPHYHPLSRPPECEAEAINRMILFAKMAGDAPLYIVHLSNALGLRFIKNAREWGQRNLYVETCPQYLLLEDSLYDLPDKEGLKYLMCPPLRKSLDRESLWEGLTTEIDTVATDHCPFFFETQKILGKDDFTQCPSGVPGIEERLPLLFSEGVMKKRISLRRFVDLCATNPAKIFGLYPQKGVIKEGADGDILIINPDKKHILRKETSHAQVDYNPYQGMELTGYPEVVISRGEVLVRDDRFTGNPGRGRFLKRGVGNRERGD